MPRILARIGWLEQELGGPAQPDDAVGILVEYGQHRHLLTFLIFPVIVALEAVPGGRYHLEITPAVMGYEGRDPLDWSLGHRDNVRAQPLDVGHGAVPIVEQRRTGRAWPFRQRQLGCRTAARGLPFVVAVPREHIMIDDQSVGARAKQLGQSHLRGRAVSADVIELIILRDLAAGRQRPDLRRYRFHCAPECHFSRQEFSARLAIRRSLVREDPAHGHLIARSVFRRRTKRAFSPNSAALLAAAASPVPAESENSVLCA